MCALEIALKVLLIILTACVIYRIINFRESFAPWDNHGGLAIRVMPSNKTGTTRDEKDYIAIKHQVKNRKNALNLVAPITFRHIINKHKTLNSFL
tara:strand:+ start:410 stop:694 length:285 start_codon:yes stop_codon:yes gene_type:complete